jgi:hypothetical protein
MFAKWFPLQLSARGLFLALFVALAGFILFGWVVSHTVSGSQRVGRLGEFAVKLASLPDEVRNIANAKSFADASDDGVAYKTGFERLMPPAADAPEAGILISRYSVEAGRFIVELISERDGKVWRSYDPESPVLGSDFQAFGFEAGFAGARARYLPTHPFLMEDGGLVFTNGAPLVRFDACGKLMWTVPGRFHHAIEQDADGNLWVPRLLPEPSRKSEARLMGESELVQVDANGKVSQHIPLYPIFAQNDLQAFIDGRPSDGDPYHINDIQPVLTAGPYWQKGDLFLSLRNLSMIMLYRPSTGKVIWHREGPWLAQHDVNILDDHRISIFDNNVSMGFTPNKVNGYNRMAIVDFRTGAVSFDYDEAFKRNAIKTVTEGRGTIVPGNDVFVEETNFGRLMRVAPDGSLQWRYIHAKPDGTRMTLGWSRFLDPATFGQAMKNAREAKCQAKS